MQPVQCGIDFEGCPDRELMGCEMMLYYPSALKDYFFSPPCPRCLSQCSALHHRSALWDRYHVITQPLTRVEVHYCFVEKSGTHSGVVSADNRTERL